MAISIKRVRSKLRRILTAATHPTLQNIRSKTGGLLPIEVYNELYKMAAAAPPGDIVEVGAASGTGSIVMARARQRANVVGKIIAIEKCEGGTRTGIGNYEDNKSLLTRHFASFDVAQRIALFPHYLTHENAPEVHKLIEGPQLAALVHDADGRIDRDLSIFWHMLPMNAPIVVDDYKESYHFKPISDRYPQGGAKELITYRLLNAFADMGYVTIDQVIVQTAFCRKVTDKPLSSDMLSAAKSAIKDVVTLRDDSLEST